MGSPASPRARIPHKNSLYRGACAGDFDDDGHLDLCVTNYGRNLLFRNDGHGAFTDGDLDLVVSNMDDVPTLLENRQRTGNHWIALRLQRPGRNRFCIGARVTLEGDLLAHFGLGSYAGSVRMTGGARWRWRGLSGDRVSVLKLEDEERIRE